MQTSIQLRPFHSIDVPRWFYFYRAVNWLWWIQRAPMFFLAIPAAYNVAAFTAIGGKVPDIISFIAGLAFESTYCGCIAFGDQMSDDDTTGRWIWLGLNIAAVFASALFSILYFSEGKYANITAESITHGLFLPILNFFYGFLLHHISSRAYSEQKEVLEKNKYHCEYCNLGRPSKQSVWSHYKYCAERLAGNPKKYPLE